MTRFRVPLRVHARRAAPYALALTFWCGIPDALPAQAPATFAEAMAAGTRASEAHRSAQALSHFEAAIALDSTSAIARWKAAREAVDLGEVERDAPARKAWYERATAHARKAVALAPDDAEAHFHLSRSIGRMALDVGPRDRVKLAGEVRAHAMRALELQPRHPGASHVLGVWHAEVMRLNRFTRAIAKTFLGGEVLGTASWSEAARLLEQAVAASPRRAVHRLDLARIYRDMGRTADARREYQAAIDAPAADPNDAEYKRRAAEELRDLE